MIHKAGIMQSGSFVSVRGLFFNEVVMQGGACVSEHGNYQQDPHGPMHSTEEFRQFGILVEEDGEFEKPEKAHRESTAWDMSIPESGCASIRM